MAKIFEIKKVTSEWDGAWFCEKCWKMHHWKEKAYVDQDIVQSGADIHAYLKDEEYQCSLYWDEKEKEFYWDA